MRKQYIAIDTLKGFYAKDPKVIQALLNAHIDRPTNKSTFKCVRVIEVTYPDNETDQDDITFYQDGGFKLHGKTTAKVFDEEEIAGLL